MKKTGENLVYSSSLFDNYKDLEELKNTQDSLEIMSDEEAFNYWNDENTLNWEYAKEYFDIFFKENTILLIGTLGLWNGKQYTGKIIDSAEDFYTVLSNYDDVKIWSVNGKTYLNLYHHDGTNYFEIRVLNMEHCEKTLEKIWGCCYNVIEDLGWDKLTLPYYSKKIDLCKLMYS